MEFARFTQPLDDAPLALPGHFRVVKVENAKRGVGIDELLREVFARAVDERVAREKLWREEGYRKGRLEMTHAGATPRKRNVGTVVEGGNIHRAREGRESAQQLGGKTQQ